MEGKSYIQREPFFTPDCQMILSEVETLKKSEVWLFGNERFQN